VRKIFILVALAFLLRLVIIPITIHPDINGYNFGAYLISQKGQALSFYDHLSSLGQEHPLVKIYGVDLFIYPPLLYLLMGAFMKILSPFYPWQTYHTLLLGFDKAFADPNLPRLLFLLKAPFLIFDILGLILIGKLFEKPKEKFLALSFWLFNPLIFYSSYMMAQFDILIAVSILAALYFHKIKKPHLAALSLGLGGLIKMFPLLLLPFYAFSARGKLKERIILISVGLFVYILGILPYLGSQGFRRFALLAPQTDKMFFAKIPVTGSEFLPIFLVVLVLLLWFSYYWGHKFPPWQWFLAVLLLFFSVTHYHPNWFIWLSAPLIIFLVQGWSTSSLPTGVLFLCFVIIVFTFDSSLNLGLFRMLSPELINFSFRGLLARFYDPNLFASIIRGLFAATSLFVSLSLFSPSFTKLRNEEFSR
jgi:hypothetical protein